MKFLLDVPCVRVNRVQVRGVLYPDIATVKSVFKLHCYIIALPWVLFLVINQLNAQNLVL